MRSGPCVCNPIKVSIKLEGERQIRMIWETSTCISSKLCNLFILGFVLSLVCCLCVLFLLWLLCILLSCFLGIQEEIAFGYNVSRLATKIAFSCFVGVGVECKPLS